GVLLEYSLLDDNDVIGGQYACFLMEVRDDLPSAIGKEFANPRISLHPCSSVAIHLLERGFLVVRTGNHPESGVQFTFVHHHIHRLIISEPGERKSRKRLAVEPPKGHTTLFAAAHPPRGRV